MLIDEPGQKTLHSLPPHPTDNIADTENAHYFATALALVSRIVQILICPG